MDKKYFCEICKTEYTTRGFYENHIKLKHPSRNLFSSLSNNFLLTVLVIPFIISFMFLIWPQELKNIYYDIAGQSPNLEITMSTSMYYNSSVLLNYTNHNFSEDPITITLLGHDFTNPNAKIRVPTLDRIFAIYSVKGKDLTEQYGATSEGPYCVFIVPAHISMDANSERTWNFDFISPLTLQSKNKGCCGSTNVKIHNVGRNIDKLNFDFCIKGAITEFEGIGLEKSSANCLRLDRSLQNNENITFSFSSSGDHDLVSKKLIIDGREYDSEYMVAQFISFYVHNCDLDKDWTFISSG